MSSLLRGQFQQVETVCELEQGSWCRARLSSGAPVDVAVLTRPSPELTARLQALTKARHPNLPELREVIDLEDGSKAAVFAAARGRSVSDRIENGSGTVAEAIDWACRVGEAIAVLHDAGIVHGDIEPGWVRLVPGRGPMLTGLVLNRAEGRKRGFGTDFANTLRYTPPEQPVTRFSSRPVRWSRTSCSPTRSTGRRRRPSRRLLEAMQERQVTRSAGRTIRLDEPFCVMATQNPVEQEGTYPLPEAQLDRFLFKLVVDYPTEAEVHEILERTTGSEQPTVEKATDGPTILELRKTARAVAVPEHVRNYAVRLVIATQPGGQHSHPSVNEFCALGSSPRGAQSLILAGKVRALLDGRFAVSTDDIQAIAMPVLRHRILINFRGQSEGVRADDLIAETLRHVSPESVVAG